MLVDYHAGEAKDRYDKGRALDPALALGFVEKTQPKLWASLSVIHEDETSNGAGSSGQARLQQGNTLNLLGTL